MKNNNKTTKKTEEVGKKCSGIRDTVSMRYGPYCNADGTK